LGSRVRMNVQLTDTETEGLLWAERFEIDRRNDRRPPRPDAASGAS